jgi:hypothetical protein
MDEELSIFTKDEIQNYLEIFGPDKLIATSNLFLELSIKYLKNELDYIENKIKENE